MSKNNNSTLKSVSENDAWETQLMAMPKKLRDFIKNEMPVNIVICNVYANYISWKTKGYDDDMFVELTIKDFKSFLKKDTARMYGITHPQAW